MIEAELRAWSARHQALLSPPTTSQEPLKTNGERAFFTGGVIGGYKAVLYWVLQVFLNYGEDHRNFGCFGHRLIPDAKGVFLWTMKKV